jgi:hypothetical protein
VYGSSRRAVVAAMALAQAAARLDADLSVLAQHMRDFAANKPTISSPAHFSLLDEAVLEGLLSRVWQAWGVFCRTCFINSCLGTTTATGNSIPGLPNALSEPHVSAAAIAAAPAKPRSAYWGGGTNALLRREPTWGDVDVLSRLLTRLKPSNHLQMSAAFSGGAQSIKALQTIRNGAAHTNPETLAQVQSLRSAYVVYPIGHPIHALYWIAPSSSDFLITDCISELRSAAQSAVQ